MMIKFVDFKKRYKQNKKDIDFAIGRVLESGSFILGKELKKFEKNFAKYLGVRYVVGVNSGTDAIFLALKSLGIKAGDEVITVANTATATISAIRLTGAMPVFVDIDELTMSIDVSLITQAITKKTKAILPVHLYGQPVNINEILKIAKRNKLIVIEDACQASGTMLGNKKIGSFGEAGCFSFYPTKNLGAFGDAGAVATNNKKLALKLQQLRNYGEESKYNNKIEGINSRLDEMQAALLNWGLKKLDYWNKKREFLANIYLKELKQMPVSLPVISDKKIKPAWHLFVIRVKNRDKLKKFLSYRGVQTSIHYPKPIFKQNAYKYLHYSKKDLPTTSKAMSEILSLPLYPELEAKDIYFICQQIKIFYGKDY